MAAELEDLLARFSLLSDLNKARVLTKAIHYETINARDQRTGEQPARSLELIHRLCGCVMALLDGRSKEIFEQEIVRLTVRSRAATEAKLREWVDGVQHG